MPLVSIEMLVSWPGAKPSCVMSVTPKPEPNCVELVRSSWMPGIASVAAPLALVLAGTFNVTGPVGAVGAAPLAGKVIVVTGVGAALVPPTEVPLAGADTCQASGAAFRT